MATDFTSKLGISLDRSSKDISSAFDRLSSGKRINRASDDAAGLAIVAALEADVKTTLQGARNAVDGVSIANIADSALGSVSDINTRQAELAAQASNGTLSDEQRASLNTEYQELNQEKQRILSTTEFNGVSVFSQNSTTLQVGTDASSNSQIQLPSTDTSSLGAGGDISTQAGAQAALDASSGQTQEIASLRGQIGAVVSRLEKAENNARNSAVESETAASRIRDADIADEAAKLTSARIRQDSTAALQAQAGKLNANTVLRLLQ
jgi:flagellin